ncbi:pyridoxamine 5'-phosphate oxidase family protein [Zavarzinia sp. CC-PAN008]|uniref:pyridoxamine 5'-phosphate oxidase family protein n=1 Tax=Zavarzinia sp. CC-PAN008 TaxID=3243332 RepID=UPI003F7472E5
MKQPVPGRADWAHSPGVPIGTGNLAMTYTYLDLTRTPGVKAAQAANGAAGMWDDFTGDRQFDRFTEAEVAFIAARDSFYMATVSETGWPYVQHRGGPAGFLTVLDDRTLGFADYRGNRQYISLGNLAGNDRVSLFLMDYPNRRRLKILARAEVRKPADDPDLARRLSRPTYRAVAERLFVLHLEAFDWNCSQHIQPRFTTAEVAEATHKMGARIAALEAENAALRAAAGGAA